MQITKITIGRLYNLGNYEHVRYELTVELKEGETASTATRGVENILDGLDPKRGRAVPDDAAIAHAEMKIKTIAEEMTDDQVANQYGRSKVVVLDELKSKLQTARMKKLAFEKHRDQCRALFDDLGGAAVWKDAKQDWDNDYEFD